MKLDQSVNAGDGSENYLSARDINITNVSNENGDEYKVEKLTELKISLQEDCKNDFLSLAEHVVSKNIINKEDDAYYIEDLNTKIECEIQNNIEVITTKINDITKIEDILMEKGVYKREVKFNINNEVKERVEGLLNEKKSRDNTIKFIKNNKLSLLLCFLTILMLLITLVLKQKLDSLQNNISGDNSIIPVQNVYNEPNYIQLPEHGAEIIKFKSLNNGQCMKKGRNLISSYNYGVQDTDEDNLWLFDGNYKTHIKCYAKYNFVLYVVIGEDRQGVVDRMNLIRSIY